MTANRPCSDSKLLSLPPNGSADILWENIGPTCQQGLVKGFSEKCRIKTNNLNRNTSVGILQPERKTGLERPEKPL